ncbi:Hypothetical protein R9X50_00350100 [Acrodontium crateriforme]|uniref:Tat pathway signal sequence n=1 Tax=Acrodontium crateriforme TaxID=150365 RepID=A0AAQ3M6A3_9PEZI|nr:Hypothetical protein R9X50_00350100 [Acrodontium crateriforme]
MEYLPVSIHGKYSSEENTDDEEYPMIPTATPSKSRANIFVYVSSAMLLSSIIIFAAAFTRVPSELECAKRVSPWSSMWDAIEFWEGDTKNSFNHSTIYRGPPTPEREQAWDELWHYPGMPVSAAGLAALNKTNDGEHVQINGSNPAAPTYGSLVQVFHQLHCLDMIRKYTWYLTGHYHQDDESIEYPWDFVNPVAGRMHVDHCIEELRIDLMCSGDITPLLVKYDKNRAIGRVADFDVHHKCRDFEKIVDWIKVNGVSVPFAPGTHH